MMWEVSMTFYYNIEADTPEEAEKEAQRLFANEETRPDCWVQTNYLGDFEEPIYIDDDCGFDPYAGCYTDDC